MREKHNSLRKYMFFRFSLVGGALWLGQLPNGIVLRIASSAVRSVSPVLVDFARNLVDGLGSRYVKACRHLASS